MLENTTKYGICENKILLSVTESLMQLVIQLNILELFLKYFQMRKL